MKQCNTANVYNFIYISASMEWIIWYVYCIIVYRYSPKQDSVTSLSSTLPVPALHIQTVALPPVEALFAGQGRHIGSPGREAGSMYSFTGQATWRRERSVSIYTHYNVLEIKCAVTTQFVGHALTSECYCKSRYIHNYIEHLIVESNVMLAKPHLHKRMMLYTAYYQLSSIVH